jgi:hypothetical protein
MDARGPTGSTATGPINVICALRTRTHTLHGRCGQLDESRRSASAQRERVHSPTIPLPIDTLKWSDAAAEQLSAVAA